MAINDLIALIPPPTEPRDATGNWGEVEAEFGIVYPKDFRLIIKSYGSGEFFNGLLIYNPFNSWCRGKILKELDKFRIMRDGMELPLVIHPETGGLFPWGHDVNGNDFCWLTKGKPDRWPVVQLGHNEEDNPHQADVNITSFLVNYARNKYPAMLGGIRFKKQQLQFTPGLMWE